MDESILRTPDLAERDETETEPKTWGMASNLGSGMVRLCAERHGAGALAKLDLDLPTGLCQVNWIHSEISVNRRWLLYAISMA